MSTDLFDVVQIGYGPVGQTMATLLGQQGHSVIVFERFATLYPFARAGHLDHEIMRILQSVGVADEFEKLTFPGTEYDWFNAEGKVLLHGVSGEAPSGWPADILFYQPELEELLHRTVQEIPSVQVYQGWEAIALTQYEDYVEVTVREVRKGQELSTGETRTVRARYLIGADGANSFVRQASNIESEDLGFQENWLVVDYRPNDPDAEVDMPVMAQLCEPARPTTLGHQGTKYCRWEFMLLPGERPEEMATPEKVWELLSRWVKPDEGVLLRHVVYTFRSILSETWCKGRTLLVGDAAHLMPPFLGQGLCSGLRDAKNLSWKLDLVLNGKADDSLLDAYTLERKPHVRNIIEQAVMFGKIVCITDPVMAAARDAYFLAGNAPPPPSFPGLTDGVLYRDTTGAIAPHTGQLSVQCRVTFKGQTGRFDDLVGKGWVIVSQKADPRSVLTTEQLAFLENLGATIVQVNTQGTNDPDAVVDVDGTYSQFFMQSGFEAVIVRPDFYIFGGIPVLGNLSTLVDELQNQVTGTLLHTLEIPGKRAKKKASL